MKIRKQAPWFIATEPVPNETVDKFKEAMGHCYECKFLCLDVPMHDSVMVRCGHPDRKGLGAGLSLDRPCGQFEKGPTVMDIEGFTSW